MSLVKLKSFFKLFCILILLPICCYVRGQTIIVNGESVYSFKSNSWEFLTSNNRNLQINEILALFKKGEFKSVNSAVLNGGIASKYYWIHFSVLNKELFNDTLFIDVQSPRLNKLKLYEAGSTEIKSLGELGDFSPFKQRAILNKNYIYTVNFQPNQLKDYYLFINQVGNTLIVPIQVFTPRSFQEEVNEDYIADGVTYGILICVSLFSLLFFINTKDTLYLYYSLYILTGILWLFSYFGIGYQYLWGDYPNVSAFSAPLMASFNILINIQICKILLQLKNVNVVLHKIGFICQYLLLGIGLFPLLINLNNSSYSLNRNYLLIFLAIILISTLFILVSVIVYSLKGSLSAKVYFTASSFKVGSIINLALLELGFVPAIYGLETVLQIGILIETTLLTYAIANRYSSLQKENEKFGRVLLNTQLEIQEQTFQNISQEIHDNIGQTLSFIKLNINMVSAEISEPDKEKLDESKRLLTKVIQDLRDLSKTLNTDLIKEIGLIKAIEQQLEILQKSGVYKTHLLVTGEAFEIPLRFKLVVFRVVQEALNNIVKHSDASSINILVNYQPKKFKIIVNDNGKGFDAKGLEPNRGIGFRNMVNRMKLIKGSVKVDSVEGKGTSIIIELLK